MGPGIAKRGLRRLERATPCLGLGSFLPWGWVSGSIGPAWLEVPGTAPGHHLDHRPVTHTHHHVLPLLTLSKGCWEPWPKSILAQPLSLSMGEGDGTLPLLPQEGCYPGRAPSVATLGVGHTTF